MWSRWRHDKLDILFQGVTMSRTLSPGHRSRTNRFLPRLEVLEDRRLMACKVIESAGVLTIIGDNRGNDIEIVDDGTSLEITCDGKPVDHSDDITSIIVNTRNGNDSVSYELSGDLAAGTTRSLSVVLGNGKDSFEGSLDGNLLAGANLSLGVMGGNGKDELNFAGEGAVMAGAALSVMLNGGNASDIIDATFTGLVEGDLQVSAVGGNAPDWIVADLTLEAGSTGTVDAEVLGGNGPDRLTLKVQDNSGDDGDPATEDDSTLAELVALLDGGRGRDYFRATDNVDVLRAEREF
jgi:hypothetical protein